LFTKKQHLILELSNYKDNAEQQKNKSATPDIGKIPVGIVEIYREFAN
jgi:hypothetical protein